MENVNLKLEKINTVNTVTIETVITDSTKVLADYINKKTADDITVRLNIFNPLNITGYIDVSRDKNTNMYTSKLILIGDPYNNCETATKNTYNYILSMYN